MSRSGFARQLCATVSTTPRSCARALRFALVYVVLGTAWILVSDNVTDLLVTGQASTLVVQHIKGLLFILVTAVLIFWIAVRAFANAENEAASLQLDQTNRLLDTTLGHLGEAVLVVEPSTRRILRCNQSVISLFGYPETEILGHSTDILHVDHGAFLEFRERSEPALEASGVYHTPYRMKRRGGEAFDAEITVATLRRESGWRAGVVLIIRDISARVRAYESLAQSERTYRLLADNTLDVIWSTDTALRFTYVNPAVREVTGYSPEEFVGTSLRDHCDDKEFAKLWQIIKYEVSKGQPSDGTMVEIELLRKDGGYVPVEVHGKGLYDEDGRVRGMQGTARDIRERRALEAQLRQSQKLEAIGTLAAGIAHEVNNPITSITGFAGLIARKTPEGEKVHEYATRIQAETERVESIIRNLLSYARVEEGEEADRLEIAKIVDSTLVLFGAALRHDGIDVVVDIPGDLPPVLFRHQQAQQVLMNLLSNARDALNDRYPGFDDDKRIRISAAVFVDADGRWVRAAIEDSGPGIPEDRRERIFEPFYTTKPSTRGTGLGLWMVYGIVHNHGGRVSVESDEGRFTRFHIDLRTTETP